MQLSESELIELEGLIYDWRLLNPSADAKQITKAMEDMTLIFIETVRMRYQPVRVHVN